VAGKSRRRGRNQWWQLIAFLMKTFHLSIGQIAQMDLVQIYAITAGYRQMQGTQTKSLSVAELEELMGNG
jgi:hypothetical protein